MRAFTSHTGSSPHVRGAHQHDRVRGHDSGIIPACAGSTMAGRSMPDFEQDHPRMCGEHQVRGDMLLFPEGSSPHVRGALWCSCMLCAFRGIIPACAGSTL